MKKYFTLLLLAGMVAVTASAQQARTLSGIVTDSLLKSPLAHAVIRVKGGNVATTTNKKGQFSLKVATGKVVLEVNAPGYSSVEMAVTAGQNTVKVSLTKLQALNVKKNQYIMQDKLAERETSALNEVVVTGYAAQHRKSVSVSSASMVASQPMGYYNAAPANTEDYSPISENIFHNATDQPLSTLSIDVDRASYSNVRRFLNQGMMPQADAVRVEEMINYFDYHYKAPTGKDPVAIYTDMAICPWNTANQLVRVALKSKQVDTRELPPSNLVFLIDVSGSMSDENKLPLVKRAFKVLTEQLRAEDKVAIAVYAGAAGVVLPPTSGSEKKKILAAIEELSAGGSTAGGEGIRLAYDIAGKLHTKNSNTRVILATDGDFNVGVSSDGELTRIIENERQKGVFLSVLGFGMGNYKDNKLELLADKGNGNYAYIDNFEEARRTFVTEFGGTLFTVAKDVKLQVEFNPQFVQSYRLVGYENRLLQNEDFNNDKKDAGDMGVGHTVTALYEIVPSGKKATSWVDPLKYQQGTIIGNSTEVLTVKLRYKQPAADNSQLMEKVLPYSSQEITAAPEDFRMAASVAAFGQLLRHSAFKGTATYDQVLSWAGNARGEDAEGYRAEFLQLVKKAKLLDKE